MNIQVQILLQHPENYVANGKKNPFLMKMTFLFSCPAIPCLDVNEGAINARKCAVLVECFRS